MPNYRTLGAVVLASTALISISPAEIVLSEDFDGGGVNSIYAFSGAAALADLSPLANANTARITPLTTSQNNSIAFDEVDIRGGKVTLEFDFRLSDDAANTAAGGCCGEAADGIGVGLFDTATYGDTGAINPATAGQQWETPSTPPGFPAALIVSFDIFEGNLVRVNGVGGPTDVLHAADAPFILNNNLFHRARLTANAAGSDSSLSLELIEDVAGAAISHTVFENTIPIGLDLSAVSARLIVGGRTGGAVHQSEIDNISIDVLSAEDLDDDGMADFWETENGVDDPAGDPDGDTLTNLQEFQTGTDPNEEDTDGDNLRDDFETDTGSYNSPTDTGTDPIDPDSDNDGLRDGYETATGIYNSPTDTGSDPNVDDTDDDLFDDGAEVAAGTDPNNPNEFPSTPILLGIGPAALLGGDLTDPENDGDPESDINYNATFAASEEGNFGGGEGAFNVFDNELAGGNTKWCCGDGATGFPGNPLWVSATFEEAIELTHFTIASANDTPTRDPRVWEIQGSNDGINFDTIFRQDDPNASLWTDFLQVLRFDAGIHFTEPEAYTTIRFTCFATGSTTGARYQLGEIEFFGVPGSVTPLQFTDISVNSGGSLDLTWNSKPGRSYIIDWSSDLQTWNEINDNYPSGGDNTTYEYTGQDGAPLPIPAQTQTLYFRVTEGQD